MKVIGKNELNDKKYQDILDGLAPELIEVVKTAAAENGIREDVFLKLKEINFIESTLLYDFLKAHFYGPEWYGLFEKILKEKENGESYLEIVKEICEKNKFSAADVEYIYKNTDSEYGFQKVLEEEQNKSKKKKLEKEELQVSAPTERTLYENFYEEITKQEAEILIEQEMDQHDQLVAAVINSNNEYKDMKNRLKEMERVARMQNNIIIQYKNNVDNIQDNYDKLKTAYEQLQKENDKLKNEYASAMSRLAEINNFTAGNSGNTLFP